MLLLFLICMQGIDQNDHSNYIDSNYTTVVYKHQVLNCHFGPCNLKRESKQLQISFLLFEQMSLLMYNVHNNLAPNNIKNMFTKLSSVHSYRTRSVTNENYYVEQVRTENMKRAFSISGALIWNSIPLSIKTLKKINSKAN